MSDVKHHMLFFDQPIRNQIQPPVVKDDLVWRLRLALLHHALKHVFQSHSFILLLCDFSVEETSLFLSTGDISVLL